MKEGERKQVNVVWPCRVEVRGVRWKAGEMPSGGGGEKDMTYEAQIEKYDGETPKRVRERISSKKFNKPRMEMEE